MSARLAIAGDASRSSFWIETPVVRIGSAPGCDLRLRDSRVAPVAVLINYNEEEHCYEVYNRSNEVIHLGDLRLPPNGSARWTREANLDLGSVRLNLIIEDDPRPMPKRDVPAVWTFDRGEEISVQPTEVGAATGTLKQEDIPEKRKSFLLEWIVTVLCVILAGLMLLMKFNKSNDPSLATEAQLKSVDELIQELDQHSSDERLARIQQDLRLAKSQELRGNLEEASKHYLWAFNRLRSSHLDWRGQFFDGYEASSKNR